MLNEQSSQQFFISFQKKNRGCSLIYRDVVFKRGHHSARRPAPEQQSHGTSHGNNAATADGAGNGTELQQQI